MIARVGRFLRQYFALLVVAVAFAWSAVAVLHNQTPKQPADTIVLHIGHWQLESGVRDGIDRMAAQYTKTHPNVRIVQDAIPESTYGTWLTTQLMGGHAPDMIEMGLGVNRATLLRFYSRYFVPLTTYINQPNPYTRGTEFENVPWRKTFRDAGRGSYVEELQENMTIGLSQHGVRVFYNRDLLKKLTGLEAAPRDFRGFLAVCNQIRRQKNARGQGYIPIAGSAYHEWFWEGPLADSLTFAAVPLLDFNRDGAVGNDEFFTAITTGRLRWDDPAIAARFRMKGVLTGLMQPGWTGLGRDEAVFLFAQQRAVFIATGTWDAGSLRELARGNFDLGLIDFPYATRTDPDFGRWVAGPLYENLWTGFSFGITRTCPHPEVALDFLQFLSSPKVNEEFNRIIGWIPSSAAARVDPSLADFEPHLRGVFGCTQWQTYVGGDTYIKWLQLSALYNIHQISFTEMMRQYGAYYADHAPEEFAKTWRDRKDGVANDEQLLAGIRARALAADQAAAARPQDPELRARARTLWTRYRQLTAGRIILRDLDRLNLNKLLADGPAPDAVGPYQFRPAALDAVRRRLRAAEPEVP